MTSHSLRSTGALVAVSSAAAAAALRIFTDLAFVIDAALIVAVGHVVPWLLRRLRSPWWLWAPVTVFAMVLVLLARHLSHTTWWGLPTGHTLTQAREVQRFAAENLPTTRPPVPFADEWALLFCTALAFMVLTVELLAHGVGVRRWALVPGGVTFAMFLVFGRDEDATTLTAVFVVVVLVALGLLAPTARRLPASAALRPHPLRRMVGWGGTVTVATVAGVLVGPALPGTDDAAWIPVRGRSAGSLMLDHPIVDIRGRLVDQSTIEMFQVISERPSYWRLASLAEFDGVTFTVPRRQLFRLDLDTTASAAATLRHEVVISKLPGRLVPAAPQPTLLDRRDVRFNPDTAALVTTRFLDEGERFTIVSAPPDLTAAQLMGPATTSAGPAPDPVYTALPATLPATVAATARQVVAGWGLDPDAAIMQPYLTALALQDWFRGSFDYRLDVTYQRGHQSIAAFLAQREGYCEQFAIAFAVMARTLGIPARVAVGFTPGERLLDGAWSVQGRHAHAWPEVWFADAGWVGFEPTPGRGQPGAETYTGVPAAQDSGGGGTGPGGGPGTGSFQPGAAPNDITTDSGDPFADVDVVPDVPVGDITIDESPTAGSPLPVLRVVAALLVLVLGAGPYVVRALRHQRRRRRAVDQVVTELWPRVNTWLTAARVPVTSSMTPREIMALTSRHHPDVARAMAPLVADVEGAVYAGPGARTVTSTAVLNHVAVVRRVLARKRRLLDRVADHVRPWRD